MTPCRHKTVRAPPWFGASGTAMVHTVRKLIPFERTHSQHFPPCFHSVSHLDLNPGCPHRPNLGRGENADNSLGFLAVLNSTARNSKKTGRPLEFDRIWPPSFFGDFRARLNFLEFSANRGLTVSGKSSKSSRPHRPAQFFWRLFWSRIPVFLKLLPVLPSRPPLSIL